MGRKGRGVAPHMWEQLGHVELHWGLGDRLAACLKLGWEGSRI